MSKSNPRQALQLVQNVRSEGQIDDRSGNRLRRTHQMLVMSLFGARAPAIKALHGISNVLAEGDIDATSRRRLKKAYELIADWLGTRRSWNEFAKLLVWILVATIRRFFDRWRDAF